MLARVADGESVRAACRVLGLHHAHVLDKLNSEAWRDQYARATEERGVVFGEKVIAVGEACLRGQIKADDGAVYYVDPNQCRVAMAGFQWAAERMASKLLARPAPLRAPAGEGSEQWRLILED